MDDTSGYKTNVRPEIRISLFLVISTLAVYWQVSGYDFVSFDDYQYITQNPIVLKGLSSTGIREAFTKLHAGYWLPVTWLSLMLDYQLYGMNPGQFHLTNLIIHIANILLLFFILKKMTNAVWQSAFVAALFALHPLHVESVAWVTERKDVLSTFFCLLSIGAYLRYIRHPNLTSYLLILLWFMLGLMSKPMVVTLPYILLLTDFWPLSRFRTVKHLLIEKIPLFALSAIFCMITFFTQKNVGAVVKVTLYPVSLRIANAAVSYVMYLWKTICPFRLAVFYPLQTHIPLWQTVGAFFFIFIVSVPVVIKLKKYPFLLMGWLWYLGTFLPVIGIVQSGEQAMADRFTYIPLIGIFIMASWGIPHLIKQKSILKIAAGSFLGFCIILAYFQVQLWQNTITLFEHAVTITEKNYIAHENLGNFYAIDGKPDKALPHFLKALEIKPYDLETINQLGNLFANAGNLKKAAYYFSQAVQLAPNDAGIHYKFGTILMSMGVVDNAIRHFSDAVRIKPDYAEAHNDLGVAMINKDNIEAAIRHFSIAFRLKPDDADIRNNFEKASAMKTGK